MPRISNVMLLVADLERATFYYTDVLGFAELGRSDEFAFLDGGGTTLAMRRSDAPLGPPSDRVEVVLEVDDPEATYDEWNAAGVAFAVELRPVTSAGDRTLVAAHFRDPEGPCERSGSSSGHNTDLRFGMP